ncbi:uncharacterized protein Dsimw501_GD27535 [Drosophila simulans]|uniref:Uncharacterized protein n=1 Tax=Drosophila simulans TaxID=7240 RepID=A0A0J9R9M4_DROSI|nr:uncharacterized protein Dsimw501_GD27535 [Drosophila simulans]
MQRKLAGSAEPPTKTVRWSKTEQQSEPLSRKSPYNSLTPRPSPTQFTPRDSASGHLELDDASDASMTMTLALCVYAGV